MTKNPQTEPAPLMFSGETARMFDKSQETVRHWVRTGRLKALTATGGVLLFERTEVLRLLAEEQARR